jgi:hypothetical protein
MYKLMYNSLSLSGKGQQKRPYFTVSYENLESQVPVYIFARNRVAQLYHRALGSLFAASYDTQGYGGGIPTCLHTGNQFPFSALTW